MANNGIETCPSIPLGTTVPLHAIYFCYETTGWTTSDCTTVLKTIKVAIWTDLSPTPAGVGDIANIYFISEDKGFVSGFNYLQLSEDGSQTMEYVDGFTPAKVLFSFRTRQGFKLK